MKTVLINLIAVILFFSANSQKIVKTPCLTKVYYTDTSYKYTYDTTKIVTGYYRVHDSIPFTIGKSTYVFYRKVTYKVYTYKYIYDTLKEISSINFKDSVKLDLCDSVIQLVIPQLQLSGNCTRQADWIDTLHPNIAYLRISPNIVLKVNWDDIQTSATGQLQRNYIDSYLAWGDKMNKTYGLNIRFKLRIVAGVEAPDFVKKSVGTFVLSNVGYENVAGLAGRDTNCVKFWQPEFMLYWEDFMSKLSSIYDGKIAEIVNSATSTATGEALIRGFGDRGGGLLRTNSALSAGYTNAKDDSAITASIKIMYKYWHSTNCGMALTVAEDVNPITHKVSPNINTTKFIADYFCSVFTNRAVVGNNGLGTPGWEVGGDDYNLGLYFISLKNKYGNAIYYQTSAPASIISTLNGIKGVLDLGIAMKASLVELPNPPDKLLTSVPLADLSTYNTAYQNNR